jgi:hypothetical protein
MVIGQLLAVVEERVCISRLSARDRGRLGWWSFFPRVVGQRGAAGRCDFGADGPCVSDKGLVKDVRNETTEC